MNLRMRKLLILSVFSRCSPGWLALLLLAVGLVPGRGQSIYQFAIPTYSVYENSSNVTVAVIRTGDVSTNGSVDFNTADGSAVAGLDYQATGGTLTFAPNEIVKSFVALGCQPIVRGEGRRSWLAHLLAAIIWSQPIMRCEG